MSVQIKTTIKGDKVIMSELQKEKLAVNHMYTIFVKEEMELARDESGRNYPDELRDQKYIRTYNRYNRTRVESYRGNNQYSVSYLVISDPTYGGRSADPYVLGDAQGNGQATIHQGRWVKLYDAVTRALDRLYQRSVALLESLHSGGL